jgi:hypothetical protein
MTRERRHCPLCSRLEGDAHAFFCEGRKTDGRFVGGQRKVDNAVTRAGEGLRPFVEAMEKAEFERKVRENYKEWYGKEMP